MDELQLIVKKFIKNNNWNSPIEHRTLDLVSELGELSKEIIKLNNYGRDLDKNKKVNSSSRNDIKKIKDEMGDVMFSLINIANYFDINLETVTKHSIVKYKNRLNRSTNE